MNGKEHNGDIGFILTEYLDGNLDAAGKAVLAARLESDAGLREELRRYTALNENLQIAPECDDVLDEIDYDMQRAEIIAAVERKVLLEGPPRRRLLLRPTFRVLAAAATILLVFTVGTFMFRSPPQMVEVAIAPLRASSGVAMEFELVRQDPLVMDAPMPAGTIGVSVGGSAQPAGTFGLFN